METSKTVVASAKAEKSLIIGRMWDNGENNTSPTGVAQPRMKIRISNELGFPITISAGTEFAIWPNALPKRDGKQDPDYSVSVQLPADIVDAEIARQKAAKPAPATPAEVTQA